MKKVFIFLFCLGPVLPTVLAPERGVCLCIYDGSECEEAFAF